MMDNVYDLLTQRALDAHISRSPPAGEPPAIIALAGPPGSGKSTVAAEVVRRLTSKAVASAVVPMDGFHFSRAHLDTLPNRDEAYIRRGIHWTFDSAGVVAAVRKLVQKREPYDMDALLLPGFDHAGKDPVAGAVKIEVNTDILILEGNWLLFDEAPWNEIAQLVHQTWFIDVNPSLARGRIARRHILSGIEENWADAVKRAEVNDLPNGEEIRRRLIKPDVVVESVEQALDE